VRVCWLWLPTWVHVCLHDEFEKCSNKLRISRCGTSLTSSKLQICPNSRQVWIGKESIRDHARWSIHRVEELFIPEISMDSRKLGNSLRTRIYKTRYLYTIVYERSYSRAKRYKRRQFKIRFPRRQVEPVLPSPHGMGQRRAVSWWPVPAPAAVSIVVRVPERRFSVAVAVAIASRVGLIPVAQRVRVQERGVLSSQGIPL